jgi:hypothetical protein
VGRPQAAAARARADLWDVADAGRGNHRRDRAVALGARRHALLVWPTTNVFEHDPVPRQALRLRIFLNCMVVRLQKLKNNFCIEK